MSDKNKKIIIIVLAIILIALIIGLSFAFFSTRVEGDKTNVIKVGDLDLVLDETSKGIKIADAVGSTDEEGLSSTPATFKLINNSSIPIRYTIYLDENSLDSGYTRINNGYIRYNLEKDGVKGNTKNFSEILITDVIEGKQTINFNFRVWINREVEEDFSNQEFSAKLRIEAEQNLSPKNLVNDLLENYTNDENVNDYSVATDDEKSKMYVFNQEAGEQQADWTEEELKDYRYIGDTPSNYVLFNNELWRIIGIFTNEGEYNKKEKLVKLVRNEVLTPAVSWDNSADEFLSYGMNRWKDSSMYKLLNPGYENENVGGSLYWNSQDGTCYNYKEFGITSCSLSSQGLKEEAKKMIADAKWYLGGIKSNSSPTIRDLYKLERGTNVTYSVGYPRETNVTAKVGLIYPSDFILAAGSSNSDVTQEECYSSTTGNGWTDKCSANWLFVDYSTDFWTITQGYNRDPCDVTSTSGHNVGTYTTYVAHFARPTIYLKPTVTLTGGTGTETDPFTLGYSAS